MYKIELPYVLVVEGAMDQAFLSSFLQCDFVQTNGSEVSRETIDYIRELAKNRDIVVLTDPDAPGERIRARIAEEIPSVAHAFVRKRYAIKGKKVGVAECDKDEVLRALAHIIPNQTSKGAILMADLVDLGLMGARDSAQKRTRVAENLHLGHVNAKSFLKRLNALGIDIETLRRCVHG